MKWTKITEQTTMPDIEVIAYREDTDEMMVGFIQEVDNGTVECEDDYSVLEGVTHFIYKQELLNLLNNG